MNIMSIFQTNWLDFLTWTLAGCMGIAFVAHLIGQMLPLGPIKKPKDALRMSSQLRKAS